MIAKLWGEGGRRALHAWRKGHLENLRLRQHVRGLMRMLLMLLCS